MAGMDLETCISYFDQMIKKSRECRFLYTSVHSGLDPNHNNTPVYGVYFDITTGRVVTKQNRLPVYI